MNALIVGADVCEGCEGVSKLPAITRFGFCLACAETACSGGDGEAVGLPVPPGGQAIVDHAGVPVAWLHPVGVEALNRYIERIGRRADWVRDPVIGFASVTCTECGRVSDEFDDDERAAHLVFDEWVVIGCEGYVTPILRAAVAEVPEVLFEGGWTVEAHCQRCSETFLPTGPDDFEHLLRLSDVSDEQPCGGQGVPVARWR